MENNSNHIINKQIIEIHLSNKSEAFEVQKAIGELYNERFTAIINTLLDDHFKEDGTHYQIEKLTINLGKATLGNITEKFSEKLDEQLLKIVEEQKVESQQGQEVILEKKPFDIISFYIMKGRMPWWANNSKKFLSEQLALLLDRPTTDFKTMLAQLQFHPAYLMRYMSSFPEAQLLKSLALLTNLQAPKLLALKSKITTNLEKFVRSAAKKIPQIQLTSKFYEAVFYEFNTTEKTEIFESRIANHMANELGIEIKAIKGNEVQIESLAIRRWIKKYQSKYINNHTWQVFFKQAQHLIHQAAPLPMPITLWKELRLLLEALSTKEGLKLPEEGTALVLLPLHNHLQVFGKAILQFKKKSATAVFEKVITVFEDTDFISVENAGLVILWPFLQRFFNNLNLLENASFRDEMAKQKAVSVLQYIGNEDESTLFEGLLPLTKIICGIPLEEPTEIYALTKVDKEIVNNFLEAVIQQGKSWGNISVEGFRTSYLQRQASLRIRDDHWLLQVQKETYDVLLQKIPWSLNAVKLPWMEKLLMVEWL